MGIKCKMFDRILISMLNKLEKCASFSTTVSILPILFIIFLIIAFNN